MRKSVLILFSALALIASAGACTNAPEPHQEAPELLSAVPSDALCVGLFSRCDNALESLVDSTSALRSLDYGRLSHARAAVALCNVGSLVPLLVLEAGKASPDTSSAARSVMQWADTLRLYYSHASLAEHNVVLLTASETVLTVALRHMNSETSILDAPDFGHVTFSGGDEIIYRNSGAAKLHAAGVLAPWLAAGEGQSLPGVGDQQLRAFLRDAAEWTVLSGSRIETFQPESEKYFCNFLGVIGEAPSKFGAAAPDSTQLLVSLPIESYSQWRSAYTAHLDARVELERYESRLAALRKASGKSPLDWEKELGVKEVALAVVGGSKLNFIRTSKSAPSSEVDVNPFKGFVSALYGDIFNAADSCSVRRGEWIISGDRQALQDYSPAAKGLRDWPARSKAVVRTSGVQFSSTNDNIRIWDFNR